MSDFKTSANWDMWENEVHADKEQVDRQLRSCAPSCTPLYIDHDRAMAAFEGSKKDYITSVDSCECIDFSRRKKPCKHMYRLVHELNIFPINVNGVVPKHGLSKSQAVEVLNNLSEEAQKDFKHLLYLQIYSNKLIPAPFENSTSIAELISSDLVNEVDCVDLKLKKKKVAYYLSLLSPEEKKTIKKNVTKGVLIQWFIDNKPEIINQICSEISYLEVNPSVEHLMRVLYKILCDKYKLTKITEEIYW